MSDLNGLNFSSPSSPSPFQMIAAQPESSPALNPVPVNLPEGLASLELGELDSYLNRIEPLDDPGELALQVAFLTLRVGQLIAQVRTLETSLRRYVEMGW